MKALLPIFLLAFTAASSPASASSHDELMQEIESKVTLPPRAQPLKAYGQNYAQSGPGKVLAIYVIPPQPYDKKISCVTGGKPCTESDVQRLIKDREAEIASQARAGERRWFESVAQLPEIADGGCSIITVRYDVQAKRVLSVGCNGLA